MAEPGAGSPPNLLALLRTRAYLQLLIVAGAIGVPVSLVAYGFVQLFEHAQQWLFTDLPHGIGFHAVPSWWPFPVLFVGGALTGLALRYLPGEGGHSPADGMAKEPPTIRALPGIVVCSLLSLSFGVVLGPEAPLIALGGGLGLLVAKYLAPRANDMARQVIALSGTFASIGTIFGSPLTAAVFLAEGTGLGGDMLTLLLLPGLLSAGIGALVFVGMGQWTGLGAATLAIPGLPAFGRPDLPELGWCLLMGPAAAVVSWAISSSGKLLRPITRRHVLWFTPLVAVVIAGLAVAFSHASGYPASAVLFSGQTAIGPLVLHAGIWTLGALALLLVFKGVAYALSLSSFRGGPVFPALLIGTAGGLLAAHLPGFGVVPGVAAGMGAMTAAMLRLPLAAVMLPTLLLLHEGIGVTPLIIVAVVGAFLTVQHLPVPKEQAAASTGAADGVRPGGAGARID